MKWEPGPRVARRKKRRSSLIAAIALLITLGPALAAGPGDTVTVSAAISLRDVLDEIWSFPAPGRHVRMVLNTAGSGTLLRQILQGAPVDLFISASPDELDRLEEDGLLLPGTRTTVAANSLVTIFPAEVDPPGQFRHLAEDRFRRIAIGNPRTVPAGRYARQALESSGLWPRLQDRLVFAESVRQVVEYVARGDVDAGVVYRTDAARFRTRVVAGPEPPAGSCRPVRYQAAVLADAPSPAAAGELLERLLAPEGRRRFRVHGFSVPEPGP